MAGMSTVIGVTANFNRLLNLIHGFSNNLVQFVIWL